MNYHNIVHDDMNNGDGIRVTLFCSGCTHACPGCHNPVTWDKNSGIPFDEAAKEELFAELSKDYISGVTLSGGDPMATFNRKDMLSLCQEIKEKFPNKTIWMYTGYTLDALKEQGAWNDFSKYVDVLVDGPFVEEKKSVSYEWAGSTNQRVLRKESGFEVNTSDKTELNEWLSQGSEKGCCNNDLGYEDDYGR